MPSQIKSLIDFSTGQPDSSPTPPLDLSITPPTGPAYPITPTHRIIAIIGASKSGKSITLYTLLHAATSANVPTETLYSENLIHCELGESVKTVHRIFHNNRRLGSTSRLILFDDLDIVLNTSGKIISEIVEEMGSFLGVADGGYWFVYTARTKASIPDIIRLKRDFFIDI